MSANRYAASGWAAILSAAGTLAVLGLSFFQGEELEELEVV